MKLTKSERKLLLDRVDSYLKGKTFKADLCTIVFKVCAHKKGEALSLVIEYEPKYEPKDII